MWQTVEDFASWYKVNKFPIRPPIEDPVYVTEISMSYVLFREGQFQAELYLVKPNTGSPEHSHPDIENIIMVLGGDIGTKVDNICPGLFCGQGPVIRESDTHALHTGDRGGAFLSLEKWGEGIKPTSVTIRWKGETCGNEHTKLVDLT
jgi:hypothetical protein